MDKVNATQKTTESRYNKILRESKYLFWSQGFDRTTMREVARACNCTQGNIYNYFSSKEDILYKAILSETRALVEAIRPLENDYDTSPVEQLRVFIERHVEHALSPPKGELLHFEMEMAHLSHSHRANIIRWRNSYDRILRKIMRRGVDAGVFAQVNEKLVNYAISSVILRARIWYSPKGDLSLSQLSKGIFELFFCGCRFREKAQQEV